MVINNGKNGNEEEIIELEEKLITTILNKANNIIFAWHLDHIVRNILIEDADHLTENMNGYVKEARRQFMESKTWLDTCYDFMMLYHIYTTHSITGEIGEGENRKTMNMHDAVRLLEKGWLTESDGKYTLTQIGVDKLYDFARFGKEY